MTQSTSPAHSALAKRLKKEIQGEVLFDTGSRGRYSTDASIYQIEPIGVVIPQTEAAARMALQIAWEAGVAVLPRGGGTSQCGQTVGEALIIDVSRHLRDIIEVNVAKRTAIVQPGVVLDQLNARLKPHGLWFPVDVSTSAQATLGGMTGNNSCGSRSIFYGNMVHNVRGIDAYLCNGDQHHFGEIPDSASPLNAPQGFKDLVGTVRELQAKHAEEIEARYPKLLRRVGGYNLNHVSSSAFNMADLLVGSEGTLAYSERIHLNLSALPRHKTLGVCHFPRFYDAMIAPQHIVQLNPVAVELVDRTMIGLARANPAFRPVVEQFIQGDPDAILLVEFAGDDPAENQRRLNQLIDLMASLGWPNSVIPIADPALQREVWDVRKAGLNIMMSMKGDAKPVSFIEDCAVPLEHLAEYTERLTQVFTKHGTTGTWYAHASVGTLHVRPILNMRQEKGALQLRAIAEEAAQLVKQFKGSYSGEHGDGLVRSEWIEPFFGRELTQAFGELKKLFDPKALMNPGKIVNPSKQDDRRLFRFKPDYQILPIKTALDWQGSGGFDKAVEMCNNNGHCRKFDEGTMCPSYRVTRSEGDLTRGRANSLRLALSGQLGPDALVSEDMHQTMSLCVSCKGCKRECPTGVDMAKMKIEFLHHYKTRHGLTLRDRIISKLPHYAPWAARWPWLANTVQAWSQAFLGFAPQRRLPRWQKKISHSWPSPSDQLQPVGPEVVLFIDTFNQYFEPENAKAAFTVLRRAGYTVHLPQAAQSTRALCCGRTFLASGQVEAARREMVRTLAALRPYMERGVPIVGLEPSCLLTMRDEFLSILPGEETTKLSLNAFLFEEFIAREIRAGNFKLPLNPLTQKKALVHGHCHQKAFGTMPAVLQVLALVPELKAELIPTSCCGMAGSFGYEAEHYETSLQMAEAALLPRLRASGHDTLWVADGTSCRHQIEEGTNRKAIHVARVLAQALG